MTSQVIKQNDALSEVENKLTVFTGLLTIIRIYYSYKIKNIGLYIIFVILNIFISSEECHLF